MVPSWSILHSWVHTCFCKLCNLCLNIGHILWCKGNKYRYRGNTLGHTWNRPRLCKLHVFHLTSRTGSNGWGNSQFRTLNIWFCQIDCKKCRISFPQRILHLKKEHTCQHITHRLQKHYRIYNLDYRLHNLHCWDDIEVCTAGSCYCQIWGSLI